MSVDPTPAPTVLTPFARAVHEATARLTGQQIPASALMLLALRDKRAQAGATIYAGTVPAHVKARRRAANKRARVARRAARA